MPIVARTRPDVTIAASHTSRRDDHDAASSAPSLLETGIAALRQSNWIGSSIAYARNFIGVSNNIDPHYSAWSEIRGTKYQRYWDKLFIHSNSHAYTEALKRQVDLEERDRRTLERAGGWGTLASVGASLFDPVWLIPVGGEVIKGGEGALMLGKAALRAGARDGLRTAAQEFGLQGSQELRTPQESLVNIASATVFSGLLEGGGAGLRARWGRAAASGEPNLLAAEARAAERPRVPDRDPVGDPAPTAHDAPDAHDAPAAHTDDLSVRSGGEPGHGRSDAAAPEHIVAPEAGAAAQLREAQARIVASRLADREIADSASHAEPSVWHFDPDAAAQDTTASRIARLMQRINPELHQAVSPRATMRAIGHAAAKTIVDRTGDPGSTVAAAARLTGMSADGRMAEALGEMHAIHRAMNDAGHGMPFDAFDEAVARAMRSGEAGENAFVTRAAQLLDEKVVKPLAHEPEAAGAPETRAAASSAPPDPPSQARAGSSEPASAAEAPSAPHTPIADPSPSPSHRYSAKRATPTGKLYTVLFEMKLDKSVWGRSRSVHFNRANAALDEALRSDPVWAAQMEALYPGIQAQVSRVGRRKTPKDWVWHHDIDEGVMQLVPIDQHTAGSEFWLTMHPGNRGGYSMWAIPNGAPKPKPRKRK